MLRIAGLFHLSEQSPGALSATNMERAVRLVGHFARHAADAFAVTEQTVQDAIELVEVLRPHAGDQLTRTEVKRRIKGRAMSSRQRMDAGLQEIEERGYIIQLEVPTGGRPSTIIRVREGL